MLHLFYLHGFASSPRSGKAAYLAGRLQQHGLALQCPDFNLPEFETLTATRMIAQTRSAVAALPPGPVGLIGSSLGGFVALHAAALGPVDGDHPMAGLLLLAPALDFGANRMRELGQEGLRRWQTSDRLEVFHYGFGELRHVRFALYEDARRYDSFAVRPVAPTVIVQGRGDESVQPAMVSRWAEGREGVTLHLVDDDHQLGRSLEVIWRETTRLFGLDPGREPS